MYSADLALLKKPLDEYRSISYLQVGLSIDFFASILHKIYLNSALHMSPDSYGGSASTILMITDIGNNSE